MTEIEEYAKNVHFYVDEVPADLEKIIAANRWRSFADLGCGDGSLIAALRGRGHFTGKEVYAVDLSENRIRQVQRIDTTFKTYVRSAEAVPEIPDGSIDVLVSSQVIEHVENDKTMLSEMHRILAPSGTVYLSTVFKRWYGWYFYRCNGKWVIDPTHLREYGKDEDLLEPINNAGFTVVTQTKTLLWFPLSDLVLRRVLPGNWIRRVYTNPLLRGIRALKIPIPGYYNWEFVLRKK